MTLFILTETSAGYALLKATDKKLLTRNNVAEQTATVEGVCSLLKLKKFEKFDSAATALEEVAALVDGKVTPMLSKLLDSIKDEKKASLAVADPKLGMLKRAYLCRLAMADRVKAMRLTNYRNSQLLLYLIPPLRTYTAQSAPIYRL